jgi:hypothetical protein
MVLHPYDHIRKRSGTNTAVPSEYGRYDCHRKKLSRGAARCRARTSGDACSTGTGGKPKSAFRKPGEAVRELDTPVGNRFRAFQSSPTGRERRITLQVTRANFETMPDRRKRIGSRTALSGAPTRISPNGPLRMH